MKREEAVKMFYLIILSKISTFEFWLLLKRNKMFPIHRDIYKYLHIS